MAAHVRALSSASACFECFGARGFALGGGDEVSLDSERGERVVRGLLGDGDRESGEGEGSGDSSVDATHLLMASVDIDVVGMKAVPQTPQGPRRLTCVFYELSTKYSSSAANTLKLYHHVPGSGCLLDIWQQTWERHERREGG